MNPYKKASFIILASTLLVATVLYIFLRSSQKEIKNTVTEPNKIITENEFSPPNLNPTALAPKNRFALAHLENDSTVYKISLDRGSEQLVSLKGKIKEISINEPETAAIIKTLEEQNIRIYKLYLNNNQFSPINNIIAADWLTKEDIIAVTDQKEVVSIINQKTKSISKIDSLSKDHSVSLVAKNKKALIGLTNNIQELPFTEYWLADSEKNTLTKIPFNEIVNATLTSDGRYVLIYSLKDETHYYRTTDGAMNPIDAKKNPTPISGHYQQNYIHLTSENDEQGTVWRMDWYDIGKDNKSKKVNAPVSWSPYVFYVENNYLFAFGEGHYYANDLNKVFQKWFPKNTKTTS